MVPDLITDMAGATAVWNALRRCGERSCGALPAESSVVVVSFPTHLVLAAEP